MSQECFPCSPPEAWVKEDVIYHPWCFVSAPLNAAQAMEGQPEAPRTSSLGEMPGWLDFCQAARAGGGSAP